MEIFRNIDSFYNEAQKACELLENGGMAEILDEVSGENSLIHGNFTYHNVIIGGGGVAVTNMERCRIDCQMVDLYQFMRKILEKYNWDIDLGFRMLNEYDKVKRISDENLSVLTLLFTFPEKFYKLVNQYHNMNKETRGGWNLLQRWELCDKIVASDVECDNTSNANALSLVSRRSGELSWGESLIFVFMQCPMPVLRC
jgi:CotS family spore coat protein